MAELAAVREPEWLKERRSDAARRAAELDLPRFKGKAGWEFTDITKLDLAAFAAAMPGEGDASAVDRVETLLEAPEGAHHLGQVDGRVVDGGDARTTCSCCRSTLACETHADLSTAPRHGRGQRAGRLHGLNEAGWTGGAFVYVPRNVKVKQPIVLTAISDADHAALHRRVLIVVELEHDQHATVQRGVVGVGDRGQHHCLDPHAARDVDERAAGPAGVVERREDVLLGIDDRAEVLVHEVGVGSQASVSGRTSRPSRSVAAVDHAAVDLPEVVRALGRLEQRLDAIGSARITLAGRGGDERRQVELRDVRELPPGLALEAREVEPGGAARRMAAALLQPLGLADGGQLSQWNPPSGAR